MQQLLKEFRSKKLNVGPGRDYISNRESLSNNLLVHFNSLKPITVSRAIVLWLYNQITWELRGTSRVWMRYVSTKANNIKT